MFDTDTATAKVDSLQVHHGDLSLDLGRETKEESVSKDTTFVTEKSKVGRCEGSRNATNLAVGGSGGRSNSLVVCVLVTWQL